MRPCDHCRNLISTEGLPTSIRMWCSPRCHDEWMKLNPEELEGWVAVGDLPLVEHAQLLASLGLTQVKA